MYTFVKKVWRFSLCFNVRNAPRKKVTAHFCSVNQITHHTLAPFMSRITLEYTQLKEQQPSQVIPFIPVFIAADGSELARRTFIIIRDETEMFFYLAEVGGNGLPPKKQVFSFTMCFCAQFHNFFFAVGLFQTVGLLLLVSFPHNNVFVKYTGSPCQRVHK